MTETTLPVLTLADLRKDCKENGIKVSMKTFSWGPHLTFSINGTSMGSVLTKEFVEENAVAIEDLKYIKTKYFGLRHNNQKVYGL